MNLVESIYNKITNKTLNEKLYNIISPYGRVVDTIEETELDSYNDSHENEDYTVQEVEETKPTNLVVSKPVKSKRESNKVTWSEYAMKWYRELEPMYQREINTLQNLEGYTGDVRQLEQDLRAMKRKYFSKTAIKKNVMKSDWNRVPSLKDSLNEQSEIRDNSDFISSEIVEKVDNFAKCRKITWQYSDFGSKTIISDSINHILILLESEDLPMVVSGGAVPAIITVGDSSTYYMPLSQELCSKWGISLEKLKEFGKNKIILEDYNQPKDSLIISKEVYDLITSMAKEFHWEIKKYGIKTEIIEKNHNITLELNTEDLSEFFELKENKSVILSHYYWGKSNEEAYNGFLDFTEEVCEDWNIPFTPLKIAYYNEKYGSDKGFVSQEEGIEEVLEESVVLNERAGKYSFEFGEVNIYENGLKEHFMKIFNEMLNIPASEWKKTDFYGKDYYTMLHGDIATNKKLPDNVNTICITTQIVIKTQELFITVEYWNPESDWWTPLYRADITNPYKTLMKYPLGEVILNSAKYEFEKEDREIEEVLTETVTDTAYEFHKKLLEASFNPNVKSSWITQIWFEPNDDEVEEDEDGEIVEKNPKDPNILGTVFMRVKNSKSGKVYPTYEFPDVPRKVYIMWRRARSKGKYFWRKMKYQYGV